MNASVKPVARAMGGFAMTLGAVLMVSQVANAAPVYTSSLEFHSANDTFATGTSSVSGCHPNFPGGGFICGSVDILGTEISLGGSANTGAGTVAGIDSAGRYTYDDLMFSDIGNPGATGSISVSANLFVSWQTSDSSATQDRLEVDVTINGGAFVLDTTYFTPTATNVTTASFLVPVNTAVTFSVFGLLRITDSITAAEGGSGLVQLLDFNLPTGFTVNSADAGVFNNVPDGAAAVPATATLPLFLTGLLGMGITARRKRGQTTI